MAEAVRTWEKDAPADKTQHLTSHHDRPPRAPRHRSLLGDRPQHRIPLRPRRPRRRQRRRHHRRRQAHPGPRDRHLDRHLGLRPHPRRRRHRPEAIRPLLDLRRPQRPAHRPDEGAEPGVGGAEPELRLLPRQAGEGRRLPGPGHRRRRAAAGRPGGDRGPARADRRRRLVAGVRPDHRQVRDGAALRHAGHGLGRELRRHERPPRHGAAPGRPAPARGRGRRRGPRADPRGGDGGRPPDAHHPPTSCGSTGTRTRPSTASGR